MFARIGAFYSKRSKWIDIVFDIVFLPIIGIYFITEGYAFLQDDPGHQSGTLYVISGSLWILCAVIKLLSHCNVVGKAIASLIAAILAISGAVLFFIA